jgi:hypothetical protein
MNHAAGLGVILAAGADPLVPRIEDAANYTHNNLRDSQVELPPETALFYVCENGHVEALIELMKYVDSYFMAWPSALGRCNGQGQDIECSA